MQWIEAVCAALLLLRLTLNFDSQDRTFRRSPPDVEQLGVETGFWVRVRAKVRIWYRVRVSLWARDRVIFFNAEVPKKMYFFTTINHA